MKSIRVGWLLVRMNAIGGTDCARKNGSPRPSRERGRARVLFQARTPLTLVLSPQITGEARKPSLLRFSATAAH